MTCGRRNNQLQYVRSYSYQISAPFFLLSFILLLLGNATISFALEDPAVSEEGTASTSSSSSTQQRRLNDGDELPPNLKLFEHSETAQVLGTTVFPKPTYFIQGENEDDEIVPYLKPVLGAHRPDKDAVFAFAAEYELRRYVVFVESLRNTGFDGDIVLIVSPLDLKDKRIHKYLASDPGMVVYAPETVCFNFEREAVASMKGGIRLCHCHNVYARKVGDQVIPLQDVRAPRTIAITRYEFYWIMAISYNPYSWIFVVDSRDTFFQSNPFTNVPRNSDPSGESGLMYFFGENSDATRLGKSKMNSKWLMNSYGARVEAALKPKPTICSGATLGERIAMEAYFSAVVSESQETGVVLMGADQGFHNYLYYSHKLSNLKQIHDIVVFEQGAGIVNNMGAMRTHPLESWGNGKILNVTTTATGRTNYVVLNWDGTPSPVVHQYDRHKLLGKYFWDLIGQEMVARVSSRKYTRSS